MFDLNEVTYSSQKRVVLLFNNVICYKHLARIYKGTPHILKEHGSNLFISHYEDACSSHKKKKKEKKDACVDFTSKFVHDFDKREYSK